MTQRSEAQRLSNVMDAQLALTDAARAGDAVPRGLRLVRWLVQLNVVLVALQAVSAGFMLSGSGRAIALHGVVALLLLLGVLGQAVTAGVLWRRGRIPSSLVKISVGLLVMVVLQSGLGYRKQYWLHVPIGVGLFGGLIRQVGRLDSLTRAGER